MAALKKKHFIRGLKKKNHFKFRNSTAKIYLNRSYTNIFITLTDYRNKVIICRTSGSSGIKGSKRRKRVPQAIEAIMKKLSVHLKLYKITKILIILKMRMNIYFRYLLKELTYYNITIAGYCVRRPKAFNGVKGRKLRRR